MQNTARWKKCNQKYTTTDAVWGGRVNKMTNASSRGKLENQAAEWGNFVTQKKHSQDKGFETTVPLPEFSPPPQVFKVFSEGFLHVCAEVPPLASVLLKTNYELCVFFIIPHSWPVFFLALVYCCRAFWWAVWIIFGCPSARRSCGTSRTHR